MEFFHCENLTKEQNRSMKDNNAISNHCPLYWGKE